MLYNDLSQDQQSEVIGSFFGYLQEVEAKQNKFAGQITMDTVILSFMAVNPKCKKNQHGFFSLDTSIPENYKSIRLQCYESVKPVHIR